VKPTRARGIAQLVGHDEAPPKEGGLAEPDRVFAEFVANSAKMTGKPAASTGRRGVDSSDEPVKLLASPVRSGNLLFNH
jgi:hypothetical protein